MIDIRLGNSREILQELESKSVDVVLTDAPYDLDEGTIHYFHDQFLRVAREWIIVFMPPENQWVRSADQYLFWVKPISTKNTSLHYSRFVEMIFVYEIDTNGNPSTWNCKRHWSQYTNVFTDLVDNAKDHPFRKPPSLIERLILNHTNEGSTVLDPFMGSGSIGEVCKRLNRNYIGIEIEPEYFKLAKNRLELS